VDQVLAPFYDRLLTAVRQSILRDGQWSLLECVPAWEGNWTWDGFVGFVWRGPGEQRTLIVGNYAPNQGQCYVRLPFEELRGRSVRLRDLMSSAVYDRGGDDLLERGLYLDLPGWGYHVFEVGRP
jgi:hypothetical protein